MKSVQLTWAEITAAAILGVMRQVTNLRDGRKQRYGAEESGGFEYHVVGCIGEAAIAKLLNKFWLGNLGDLRHDVGDVQVRARAAPSGCLLLHDNDSDHSQFYFVLCDKLPECRIYGPVIAGDCKRKEWWETKTGRPAYFVPIEELERLSGRLAER